MNFFKVIQKLLSYPDLHGTAGSGSDDKLVIGLLPSHSSSIFFLQDKLFL